MKKSGKKKEQTSSRVSVFRCIDYDSGKVLKAVTRAVDECGGISRFVKRGDHVLLKANLLIARPVDKLVTTHPEVVRAVAKLVRKAGGTPFIGDSPAMGSALKVSEKCGIADVARAEKIQIVNFNRPVEVDTPSGATFKKFKIDRSILEADAIINLPKLKTHGQMTLTLGVKNLFGVVPGPRKSQWHLAAGSDRGHFARMLLDLYRRVSPQLTILDGVIGMQGNGPQNGDPRKIGLILASQDAVALDAAVCEIVGLKRTRMPTLLAAEEMGIGQAHIKDIEIAGEKLDECAVADFIFPQTRDLMNLFPPILRPRLRNWLTTRPVLDNNKCEMCLVCVKNCPAGVITSRKDSLSFDLDRCIRCFCCQEMCPQGAISVGSGALAKLLRL